MTDEPDEQVAHDAAHGHVAPEATNLTCQLCGLALTPATALSVSGHTACEKCVAQLEDELAGSEAGMGSVPFALTGAILGGLAGAAAWAGISIGTGYEIGYVAVLVGFLAGKGTVIATRGAHGRSLQQMAVVGALCGLLVAKYAIFAHALKQYVAEEYGQVIGYLDGPVISSFFEALAEMTGMFDLLWIFLAVSAAWRVPASPSLHVTSP